MESLEDRLNGPCPPTALDAFDVEMYGFTGPIRFVGERTRKAPLELRWHRPDGRSLIYRRWEDEDAARYYQPDEFFRRAGLGYDFSP